MGSRIAHGAKLLTCSLALCWTTPSQCPGMAWRRRVHSRDRSQQAMHVRLRICDTLCPAQLSNAILAGFAFSRTTTYLHAVLKGARHTCSASCYHTDRLQHSCHIISDWTGNTHTHTHKQYFLRLRQHDVRPTGDPRPSGAVCGCRQFASVEASPQQGTGFIV